MAGITFFNEEIEFNLKGKQALKDWISLVIESEGKKKGDISFIFCDDAYLSEINVQYLKHNTLTDIITFDYTADNKGKISGDIFISIERVKENAERLNVPFVNELHRVIIHGVLHLLGYKDKNKVDKALMRQKEDNCLSLQNKK
jgi:rRNA maturation RNase YbeY